MAEGITIQPESAPNAAQDQGASLWKDSWHRLKKNRMAVVGGIILILLFLACTVGLLLANLLGYSHESQNLILGSAAPSWQHWMGTDILGRDLFVRVLYGGRISLMVGICATAVSLIIGVLYGAVSGFLGGKVDSVMMRIVDIMYALPFTIFVILLMVVFGKKLILIFLAIGAVEWLTMARIVRGQVMSLKRQEFIEAAQALGLRKRRIILRHIIPNILGPVIVYATLTVPGVMLLESFISFLGLGVQAPATSWGVLIDEGAKAMEQFPWLLIFPAGALSLALFSLNFLGDGLRDALDVRASKD
ncbi:MAG: binding-protein-dependent transport system inner rane component [Verrucomicrobiales bacterium]|nr:binding-protein-dependent transport system inner rane component [Verrucomicrobiales bacterium]